MLLNAGADVKLAKGEVTALMKASKNGHDLCARALIEAGAAVNHAAGQGETPLMLACQNNHELCARALIENGAKVDATEEDGWPTLMFAAQNGHEQVRSG